MYKINITEAPQLTMGLLCLDKPIIEWKCIEYTSPAEHRHSARPTLRALRMLTLTHSWSESSDIMNSLQSIVYSPLRSRGCLGAAAHCRCHCLASDHKSLAWEKITIQNPKNSFCWTPVALAPLWSWKLIKSDHRKWGDVFYLFFLLLGINLSQIVRSSY